MATTVARAGWLSRFDEQLARYRSITVGRLLKAVPPREPRRYLYDPIAAHLSRTGKSIRPALCIATCEAFGGRREHAENPAVAMEMLHNAFLIHDDVEDESELRRGKPTMHAEHGVPLAVNAGDMVTALSLRMLGSNADVVGRRLSQRVGAEIEHMMVQSLEGQALELGWIRDNRCDLTDADYLRMVQKKTCWYSFIHPCRIGALIGTRDSVDLDRFNRFGCYLGTAFQIQDDLLNLTGDPARYGKEIGGDLMEGKRTLMLIHLLNHASPADGKRIESFLRLNRAKRSGAEANWIFAMMRSTGSIDYARSAARYFAGATQYEFARAYDGVPDSEHKSFIHDVIRYMVSRDV